MKVNEIERLLARYYDGETSETEEKELKRFLPKRTFRLIYLPRRKSSCNWQHSPLPKYRKNWKAG